MIRPVWTAAGSRRAGPGILVALRPPPNTLKIGRALEQLLDTIAGRLEERLVGLLPAVGEEDAAGVDVSALANMALPGVLADVKADLDRQERDALQAVARAASPPLDELWRIQGLRAWLRRDTEERVGRELGLDPDAEAAPTVTTKTASKQPMSKLASLRRRLQQIADLADRPAAAAGTPE